MNERSADIAIVGMACIFPAAADVRRYWQNICSGIDAVREVPAARWRVEDFFSEDRLARDRVYSKWGGFLDPVIFDPVKWRIPPASLPHIEPMQLLSLEVAWQAMADAGYSMDGPGRKDFPRERAGVLFAVPGSHELGGAYSFRTMMRHYLPNVDGLTPEVRERIYASLEKQLPEWSEDSFAGILGNVTAGRIARELDLHGPNFTVDAACAGSLAALQTAVELLRSGTADLMLVGAADGTNNPFGFMCFAKTHALSPRGRSRPFDDSADGIALGEGVACIVVKRLSDAERDDDNIYAIVKGIGSSSDGKNRSLTAPHPPGQMRAVNRACAAAGISPASLTLIEAHGTGTAVGDAAELTALMQVFGGHTKEKQYVAVGSVKSMIGHTKTVAGLAGVIKAALALKHRVLPPTLGVENPTTSVELADGPFYLNAETRPWIEEKGEHPRRAGVSSFGFGGTNFHVVLEEHSREFPSVKDLDWTPRAVEVVALQRDSREEMARDLEQLQQRINSVDTGDLAALAGAFRADESARADPSAVCRLAIVAASVEDLRRKIQRAIDLLHERTEINDPVGVYYSEAAPVQASEVCFLYPGQGSQSVNMLRDLAVGSRWSHDLFHEANRLLKDELSQPLTRFLYPPPTFSDVDRERQTAALQDTRIAQPALGLVELFATDLLERFGVRPAFVAGHSYGELVALHVAGCFSRMDLLRLSAQRGRVCSEADETCPGAMASVRAGATETETALKEGNIGASVANRNAPDQTVIAGSVDAIDAAVVELSRRGLRARKLSVSAAFHTWGMSAASTAMKAYLDATPLQKPRLPVYSNTTGQRHSDTPDSICLLLARHLSEPVLFDQEVRQMHADGARLFLEVGPGKVLTDLVSRILKDEPITSLALDAPGRDGWTQLGHTIARLTVLGLPVRLSAWFDGRGLEGASLTDFLNRTRERNTPKASDWILSPNKAEPISAKVGKRTENNGLRTSDKAAMTMTNGEVSVNGNGQHIYADVPDSFAQFQETTRLLLEAQQAQNRVLERYFDMQERLLRQGSGGASTQPESVSAAPVQRIRPASAVNRPPVPIPRTLPVDVPRVAVPIPLIARNGFQPSVGEEEVNVKHTPPLVFSPSLIGDVPPPTETFRTDLLAVVSARTGYPIDALDEDLPLEAALGIDSIKTVEIFSNLKAYHAYFRAEDQEEEELLAEFVKLKTLRDIIDSYDRRRHSSSAGLSRNGILKPSDKLNGEEHSNGSIKRYLVAAEAAPLERNVEKKNDSLTDRSSS